MYISSDEITATELFLERSLSRDIFEHWYI